uniref:PAP-associated domain-containing protein n=1 Tax=Panagrellus redivivus TaxID=6233 RepID=A0A7E4VD61_PANRE
MRRLPRATIPPPPCPATFSRRGAAVQVTSTYQSRPDTKFSIQVKSNFKDKLNFLDNILVDFDTKRVKNFEKLKEQRRELVKAIENHICAAGNARLIPVGSLVTGLVFDVASDLDLCLFAENKNFYNDLVRNESFRIFVFKQMQSLTYELGSLNPELIVSENVFFPFANVPLQITRFKSGFSMDIQIPIHNFQAIRNTNLVKHYVLADGRFPLVYHYFRRLFDALGLRNSKDGLFSSYHLLMLTIHFLQCRSLTNPVLPVLCSTHPHRVGADVPIEKVFAFLDGSIGLPEDFGWKSENKQSAAELVVDMVDYYRRFNVRTDVIYINRGFASKKKRAESMNFLQIYDPYGPQTITKSMHLPDALETAFSFIYRKMNTGMFLNTFPNFPEASHFRSFAEWKPWFSSLKCN